MQLQVPCECGQYVPVTEGEAGGRTTCRCGRTVVILSLRELRRLAGVPGAGLSPELAIKRLLQAEKLPEEEECVLCGEPTPACALCLVEYEPAVVIDDHPPVLALIGLVRLVGLLRGFLARSTLRETSEWGEDSSLNIPMRICDPCRPTLTDAKSVKRALRSVPLYRRLLDKYPRAIVSLVGKGP